MKPLQEDPVIGGVKSSIRLSKATANFLETTPKQNPFLKEFLVPKYIADQTGVAQKYTSCPKTCAGGSKIFIIFKAAWKRAWMFLF